ncbi:histidine phosphatase family protein [Paenibacillus glycanilyticus]|uniref:Phosphoglycerate mutase n=1 Tax=Paenibacillus glycanilyticus TaxID=126569 RepID=A0ABQ6GJN5_9BACL|nr:histidine phosphatase family protein [Paenibacillus glycanilyticus]GLX70917.1 phosphoglycerate mutase [Paenibacillus glycanilyticus]
MSITFFLVRHALKEKAIGDVTLTDEGIKQAASTAKHFKYLPVTAIYSSPLRRAKETAECIAHTNKLQVAVDDRLRERANWGDLQGQTFEEFIAMWERGTYEPEYIPPIGDTSKQAGERLALLITQLAGEHPSQSNVVLVTHGGLITDFLVHHFPSHELNVLHPDFVSVQSQLIPECSVTTLSYDRGRFNIVDFASVDHLN